jgi:nucleoside 2-deoxyribosyltransferase
MKIYLAGPLFSTAERTFNARLAELLREMKT